MRRDDDAAGPSEPNDVTIISRVFTPIPVEKNHIIWALEGLKNFEGSAAEDSHTPPKPLPRHRFNREIRVDRIGLDRVDAAGRATRAGHECRRVSQAAADLEEPAAPCDFREEGPQWCLCGTAGIRVASVPVRPPVGVRCL